MFILFFTIFTFIFTVFENFFIGMFFLLLFSFVIFIYHKRKSFTKIGLLKKFGILFLAFFITFLATSRKQFSYHDNMPYSYSSNDSGGFIDHQKSIPQMMFYAGTGKILDTNSQGKYIFGDGQKRKYFLSTKRNYKIGDEIFLDGYIKPGRVEINLIYNIKDQLEQNKFFLKNISLSGFFHYQFDYETWLMMKGFYGTIYEQKSIKTQNLSVGIISKFRKNLQSKIVDTYGKNRISGLILGMLIGDKSQIPKQDYQGFIDSGLVHLIAVSGGNIIMIVTFLGFVLLFLPFYLRNFLILCVVIFYALICGLDSSVFRATIMGGLGLIVLFWGKEIDIRRSMAMAFVVMLIINPYFLAYDVGFLLSFGAIIGILYLQNGKIETCDQRESLEGKDGKINENDSINKFRQIVEKFKKTKIGKGFFGFITSYIQPTIGATIGIFPLIIFFMGKINLVSIIGNLFVLPIVPFVMIYGFVSVRAYQLLHWERIIQIEKILVTYIYKVSEIIGQKGIYLMVDGDWIKYLILVFSILIFVVYKIWKIEKSK